MPISQEAVNILFQLSLDEEAQKRLSKGITTTEQELLAVADALGETEEAAKEAQGYMSVYAQKYEEAAARAGKATDAMLRKAVVNSERLGRTLLAGGTGILAGLAASANKYVSTMKDAGLEGDETVMRWEAAMGRMKNASLLAGRAATEALLPALEKAAGVVERAAAYVDENPEIVEGLVNVGQILVGLGALSLAVSKGIRLYLGAKDLAAMLDNTSALKSLTEGMGGAGGVLGKAGLVAGGVALSLIVTKAVGEALAKTPLGRQVNEAQRVAFERGEETGRGVYPGVNIFAKAAEEAEGAAEEAAPEIEDLAGAIEKAKKEAEGAQVLTKLAEDLARMETRYAENREKVIRQSNDRIEQIYRRAAANNERALTSYQNRIGDIQREFSRGSNEIEREWANRRAKIIQDSGEEIRKIESSLQEDLRKLRLDHEDKVAGLVAQRDALGLVRERRRYEREKDEREREADRKIAERRRETALELREQRRDYELKRAQRFEQLKADLEDAARDYEQRKEEIARQREEQLAEERAARAARLRELQISLRNETAAKVKEAHAAIKAIGGALNAEAELRRRYYQLIVADAGSFMSQYQRALSGQGITSGYSMGNLGTQYRVRNQGGYADYGLYKLGDAPGGGKGGREFVMSAGTTRAAERSIQGGLTQQNILRAMSRGRGSTVNLELPAGIIQLPQLKDILRQNNGDVLGGLAKALEV